MANKVRRSGIGYDQVPVFGNEPMYAVPVIIDVTDTGTKNILEDAGQPGYKLLRAGLSLGNKVVADTTSILEQPNTVQAYRNSEGSQALLAADTLVPDGSELITASGVIKAVVYKNRLPMTLKPEAEAALVNCIFRQVQDKG